MGNHTSGQVTRRRVFYIPGYDPIHPRRYRELYRKEGAAQAAISGYDIALEPNSGSENYGWQVKGLIGGVEVDAQVDVLVWSDIVRESMNTSIPATYLQLLRTAWVYIASGALWRLMKLRKGPVIAALYPVGMLLVQLMLAAVLGCVVVFGISALLVPFIGVFAYVLALLTGGACFYGLLRWFKKKDGRFFA